MVQARQRDECIRVFAHFQLCRKVPLFPLTTCRIDPAWNQSCDCQFFEPLVQSAMICCHREGNSPIGRKTIDNNAVKREITVGRPLAALCRPHLHFTQTEARNDPGKLKRPAAWRNAGNDTHQPGRALWLGTPGQHHRDQVLPESPQHKIEPAVPAQDTVGALPGGKFIFESAPIDRVTESAAQVTRRPGQRNPGRLAGTIRGQVRTAPRAPLESPPSGTRM
jgi:hypothetical protein